jgi:thioredoxin reductase
MAELADRPFPPGRFPVVIVGSGPGGLQLSYALRRLGVRHALLSADDAPGGMFRRWPHFQRLITATKPYAVAEPGSRFYQRYDWNSLVAEEPSHVALVREFMDGTSDYPARSEVQRSLESFVERAALSIRFGCRWTGTRTEGERFVLETTDGEYRCEVAVFALGLTTPYFPAIPGINAVPHYASVKPLAAYTNRRVFIAGKRNSAFELAEGLLPHARQLVLASPSPARLALLASTTAAVRARYVQPFEDHALRGGAVFVLDAAIERIERHESGYAATLRLSEGGAQLRVEADEAIAATGFRADLGDLPALGVATFTHLQLPAQTPFWESATVPGVFFAGALMQGSLGLRKHGLAGASASLHGYRYNARVLARYLAESRFGVTPQRRRMPRDEVIPLLLAEATRGPELWHQRSYLCRAVTFASDGGAGDDGVLPLQHFMESAGDDGVAVTVETNAKGETYPAVYVRRAGAVSEHLLPSHPLLDFETTEHRAAITDALASLGPGAAIGR